LEHAIYFIEPHTPSTAVWFKVDAMLFSGKTKYQEVKIIENRDFGKVLLLDNRIQSSVRDEHLYHEALVHPAMIFHPSPRKVLVLGGGEGGTIREVLRHGTVEEVVMVDIDGELIEICKKYLPEISTGSFEDPRVRLVVGDGRRYVEECAEDFDVVIGDLTDPLAGGGPSTYLYTREFFTMTRSILRDGGIFVTQATSPIYSFAVFATIYRTLSRAFPAVKAYVNWVPSYFAPWGFVIAFAKPITSELGIEKVEERIRERSLTGLKFYSAKMHAWMFTLLTGIEEGLARHEKASTDESPISMPV